MTDSMVEPRRRPVEILLVEDDLGAAELNREAFATANTPNSVSIAGDGEEALRMLRREPPHANRTAPDVILLDIGLRRKHGHELIDEIGRDCLTRRIPIVLMTSSEDDIDTAKRYPFLAKSYVVKPVNIESVQRILALIDDDAGESGEPATIEPTLAERELSEFSYIVSHDLAAPLRHVAAFSTLLTRSLGPEARPEQIAYCDHIHDATQKCQAMMDELLAYSRAQQTQMNIEMCDVTLLMEVAKLQLSAEVQKASADITIEPLGKARMDSTLMTLAFKHALSNAIKFRRADAPVKIDISAETHPDAYTVRFADNGPGVALDRQEKMFRMFYQDEPEGTFPGVGVGAGLAILLRIMRRHGGSARFVDVDQGACLQLSLPATGASPATHAAG